MKHLKSLSDILNRYNDEEEVYTTDEKYRQKRKNKGYFTRGQGTFSFINLIKAWEEIVGKLLADNSIPLRIRQGTLYISTKHQIFAQEMGFMNEEIIQKIHASFPELKNLISKIKYINNEFTLQDFNHPITKENTTPKRAKLHPYSPEFKKRMYEASQLFQDIEDEEVKQALMKYYLSS